MKNFYIDVGNAVELYTLVKITKDPNIPIISKSKTKWFSNKYDITERWSAATYVAIPDGYQFQ